MTVEVLIVSSFWASLTFVFYTYVGYPLTLIVLAYIRTAPVRKNSDFMPTVSFVILAHNEETVIRRKLENTLALDYHETPFQIVVASDGSHDRTNAIVREFKDMRILLLDFTEREGKTQVLNKTIPLCRGEIIILSDARQNYATNAVCELAANFADPSVGSVTGDIQFENGLSNAGDDQISLYWRYEKWIRQFQSKRNSTPVVTGAIYAIRRSLFRPLPRRMIADDLVMPMTIVRQKYRVIYDPAAKAFDNYPRSLREEFRRRVRTIAGSYQYLIQNPSLLIPITNEIWFDFVSHKVCRILAPIALCILFISNVFLQYWPYRLLLVSQIIFYITAGIGAALAGRGKLPKLLSAPCTFLILNVAAAVALFKLSVGTQSHLWEKTQNAG